MRIDGEGVETSANSIGIVLVSGRESAKVDCLRGEAEEAHACRAKEGYPLC